MHVSFLNVARYRYALYAGLLAVACTVSYLVDCRLERPGGGTVLGFVLGGIAAAMVLFLMSYGIRRRSFGRRAGSTKRWLSLHVYFGLSVLLVATLHASFQFGCNVHTLAFALLGLVVLSGCWGVYAYLRYPSLIARERGGAAREELLARLAEADREALAFAAKAGPAVHALVDDAIQRTQLGGGIWAQLRGRDGSTLLLVPIHEHGYSRLVGNHAQQALIAQLAKHQATADDGPEKRADHQLLQISVEKAIVLRSLLRDIQLQGLLQFWLYLHLPLSFGLLAALAVHVFSVFYYR